VTYQGQNKRTVNNFEAVGTGIIKLIVDDTTVNWLALYTPNSTGTIISPNCYMIDNGHIHEFLQSGSHNGKGHLQFINSNGKTVAKVKLKRQRNGLWDTGSPVLMPPPALTNTSSVTDADLKSTPIIHKINKLDKSHQTRQHSPTSEETMPTNTTTSVQTTMLMAQASQALKQLELWHQQMGHPAPRTLQRTAQVVKGLPKIPSNFSHFHCPYCDIAKLAKKSGNPTSECETFIPGTAFHMDLGFIRGPKMVKDNMGISQPSKTQTAQQSHDGYLAYLIIVDAATSYVFCFPLKSQSPQLALINKFLNKNGQPQRRLISTSPNGLLHKSKSFAEVCKKYGYSKNAHQILDEPYEDVLSMGLERPRYYIRTDNGNKLAGSKDFCQLASDHEFIVETTAPNSSSENGLGERPHCTLKEKVRCLLYTAGLGVEFWSDALLHAVWLYNRTSHLPHIH
jgi:hypothetical protein